MIYESYLRLRVEGSAGMTIHRCAHHMVALARQLNAIVECTFNGVELIAYPMHISGDALAEAYNQAAQGELGPEMGKTRFAFSDGKHIP
jgi:hypothetical protein